MSTESATETTTEEPVVEKVEKAEKPDKTFLEMSDEDFLKINAPPEKPEDKKTEKASKAENDSQPSESDDDDKVEKADKDSKPDEEPAKKDVPPSGSKPAKVEPTAEDGAKSKAEKAAKPGEAKSIDYEGFFKEIMTPFKANGKTFEIKTPEEAIRLMQKGAGYGRKLQDLQPHLKVLRMLEKNNLLDENRLSYLIDLNQKKPDAIKKLIKEGGIDPLDLNTDDKVTYTPTNHAVTDKEVAFHQAITEIQHSPGGNATLQHINQAWDIESKGLLWESPEIFSVIQTQRENGVYEQIAAEIERQKVLGTIDPTMPFLQAYKVAGDHLVSTNGFKASTQPRTGVTPQPQVVATRTATPKSQAQNGDKAAAAASTKTVAATKPTLTVNPLEMADDDFMKQFNGRF